MAVETTYHPPLELTQGTSAEWTTQNDDYPATDGYTASFSLVATAGSLTIAGVADGADWDFTITPTQSAALHPGSYSFVIRLTYGTSIHDIEAGYVYIKPDITADQPLGVSGASPARQRHAHYMALLTNEAFVKTLEPGRVEELEQVVRRLEFDIKREEDAETLKRGGNATRKLYTRFI